jgi:hypothetical protein
MPRHLLLQRETRTSSTLACTNEHHSSELFKDLFRDLPGKFRASGKLGVHGKRKFRFKNKLLSFHSTTITLCLSPFPWADYSRPSFVHISEATVERYEEVFPLSAWGFLCLI